MSVPDFSVSKGVFVHKKKDKQVNAATFSNSAERFALYERTWKKIYERVQVLQDDLNKKIFEDLLLFVRNATDSSVKSSIQEIPTAALVIGVNSTDHAVMFQNLHSTLVARLTNFVVQLKSKDCPNVKSFISKAVSELIGAQLLDDEDEEEEQPNLRKINPSISVLAKWYQEKTQKKSPVKPLKSPRKRKIDVNYSDEEFSSPKKSQQCTKDLLSSPMRALKISHSSESSLSKPPVVFILEDFESFSPAVLQDFIITCSNHLSELPIVFVFGIATSVPVIHRLLSYSSSSLLCIEKFQAPPSSEYLTLIMDKIMMIDDVPFKLGPKVFNLLLDIFLFHDFSIVNFCRGLQFCLLEHYNNHSYSILCSSLTEALTSISHLKDKDLKSLQQLPSFQNYLELCKKEQKHLQLKSSKDLKQLFSDLIRSLHLYHNDYFPVLRCLHNCVKKLPKYPLGKQIRELYSRCISEPIWETAEYKESILLLKSLSRDELVQLLHQCCNNLHSDTKQDEFSNMRKTLQAYIEKFNNVEDLQRKADADKSENSASVEVLPEKTNLYTLRKTLQNMEMKKKKLSVYDSLRQDVFNFLDEEVFTKYLVLPSSFPLYEVFYFEDVSAIKSHMIGSPRVTIQRALADPYQYLQNEELQASGDNILPNLPDLCIVYKLHLECGKLLNLYDWLQAFKTIVSADSEETVSKKGKLKTTKEQNEKMLQARFIRAVSELLFLGFIKPTKKKTDHVARLTWGGC